MTQVSEKLKTVMDEEWVYQLQPFLDGPKMQVILDYLIIGIINSSVIKTFKANKMIKLIKIQKISRIFKLFRTIKIISIFLYTF